MSKRNWQYVTAEMVQGAFELGICLCTSPDSPLSSQFIGQELHSVVVIPDVRGASPWVIGKKSLNPLLIDVEDVKQFATDSWEAEQIIRNNKLKRCGGAIGSRIVVVCVGLPDDYCDSIALHMLNEIYRGIREEKKKEGIQYKGGKIGFSI